MKNYNALVMCMGVMALVCVQTIGIAAADYQKLLGGSANDNTANDTTISNLSGYQEKNWGAHNTTAYFGAANGTFLSAILLRFDFSNLTTSNITAANLSLFSTGELGACGAEGRYSLVANIYPLKTRWKEGTGTGDTGSTGTASWQNSTDGVPWASGIFGENDTLDKIGTSVIDCGVYKRFLWELDATMVKKMASGEIPNYGFVVRAGNFTNNPIYFYMRETSTPGIVPWLELEYSHLTPTPSKSIYDAEQSYCLDSQYFFQRIAVAAQDGTLTMNNKTTYCQYGCQNFTLTSLGSAGCQESPLIFYLMLIAVAIAVTLLIVWLGRRSM